MSNIIGSDRDDTGNSGPETGAQATLRALAGTIIPASDTHGVPGADDDRIFSDLLASAGPMLEFIGEHLDALDAGEVDFLTADPATRLARAEQFRISYPEAAALIISLIGQCYYRDRRVLESLGTPPRPPFPEGYDIDQGDWSLLDPVRARGRLYRPVD